jgi:hypothetical protein
MAGVPVILARKLEDGWLDSSISVEHAVSLLAPDSVRLMRATAASGLVNPGRSGGTVHPF